MTENPYVITRFAIDAQGHGKPWIQIATADLEIRESILVRGIILQEEVATGARRISLPRATYEAGLALTRDPSRRREITEALSAAYDDEMAHLNAESYEDVDDTAADDSGYYGSQAHQGDVPHPGAGSVDR